MSVAPAIASTETSTKTSALDGTTVDEAMHTGVMTCAPETTLVDVARAMSQHRVHCLVVEGVTNDIHGERLSWMVLSDLDLVRAVHSDLRGLTAVAMARTEPLSIESSATLRQAARMMDEHRLSHLIATEGERPVGVVSTLDVAACAARG
jgi:CBS domain-containing protein